MYGFGFGGMISPTPVAPMVPATLQQPVSQPAQQSQQGGTWSTVRSYQDVVNAAIPANGQPVIFMLENEPTFYVAYIQNGRKVVNGYQFSNLGSEPVAPVTAETPKPDNIESRIASLESFAQKLKDYMGDDFNESDTGKN